MPEVNSSFMEKTDEFSKKTVTETILAHPAIETNSERITAAGLRRL